jgi:hypothetical protein
MNESWPAEPTRVGDCVRRPTCRLRCAGGGAAHAHRLLDPDFASGRSTMRRARRTDAWLRLPQRRLVLLARQFDVHPRTRIPRFVAWRRTGRTRIDAWTPPEEMRPAADVADRLTSVTPAGVGHAAVARPLVGGRAQAVHQWRDEIDALLQRSRAAFPVHHLGL